MRFLSALLVGLCLVSIPVFADTADPPTTSFVADDVVITASAAPALVIDDTDRGIINDALSTVVDAATNHSNVTFLFVFSIAIAVVLKLSKLGLLARFLEAKHITWVRPILALVLGAAGSVAAALQQGRTAAADLLTAAAGGALAGLVGVGTYEVARLASPGERDKKRVSEGALTEAASALGDAVVAAKTDAGAHVNTARVAVATTADLSPAKRVEALAGLLKASPR